MVMPLVKQPHDVDSFLLKEVKDKCLRYLPSLLQMAGITVISGFDM